MALYVALCITMLNMIVTVAFQKSITLNNSILVAEGISVVITQNHVNAEHDIWHIDPTSQDGTDIAIHMTNAWCFHRSVPSTVTFVIDGYTPNFTHSTDGEFLILFGVKHKYFSVVIRMEEGSAWKSYPNFESAKLATTNDIFYDLIIPVSTDSRWDRLSNNDEWTNIAHPYLYKVGLRWPLIISITNDPTQNTLHYKCVLPNRTLFVDFFNDSFATNEGMSVYIMNDASDGKPFDIYSIQITADYQITSAPTMSPTINPTVSPTILSFITPSPILEIPQITNVLNTTIAYGDINASMSNTHTKKDNASLTEHDTGIYYIVIIGVLSVLLCIVTVLLIRKYISDNKIIHSDDSCQSRDDLQPNHIKDQLQNSILNNEAKDENENKSDSDDDLYDSIEKIYAKTQTIDATEIDLLKNIEANLYEEGTQETRVEVTAIPINIFFFVPT